MKSELTPEAVKKHFGTTILGEYAVQKTALMQQLAAVEKTLNTPTINELAYRQAIEQRRQLERDLAFADQNKSC